MWENFLINYLASVAAGITFAILGLVTYRIYRNTKQITNVKQNNKRGSNNITNITINTTGKQTKKLTKKLFRKYGP